MNFCLECRRLARVWLLFALVFYFISASFQLPLFIFAVLGFVPIVLSVGFWVAFLDILIVSIIFIISLLLTPNLYAAFLFPLTYILITLSVRTAKYWATTVSIILIGIYSYFAILLYVNIFDIIILTLSLLLLLFNLKLLYRKRRIYRRMRVLIDEKSKNSKMILRQVGYGANSVRLRIGNARVASSASEVNSEDSLILIASSKNLLPSFTFLKEIMHLPKRSTKKRVAFILIDSLLLSGLTALILSIALRIKGYHVAGRANYYSGLILVRALNISVQAEREINKFIEESTGDVVLGFSGGFPILFW